MRYFGDSAVMIDATVSLDGSWVPPNTQEQDAGKAEGVSITFDEFEEIILCGWNDEHNDFIDAPETDVHQFGRHVTVRGDRGN